MNEISKEKIDELFSNSEIIKLLSGITKNTSNSEQQNDSTTKKDTSSTLPNIENILANNLVSNKYFSDRIKLLYSIKPFLSEIGQKKVDSLIRVLNIVSLINMYSKN